MPFPFDKYPWLNFQELNLAYFIMHFREIFQQWNTLLNEMHDWKDATDAELAEWKNTVEAGISSWETGLQQSMEDWKDQTEADISAWEAATLSALDAWKTATTVVFEQIRTEAAASAQAAAGSATSAQTALAEAQAAQAAAETAAAGIQSELTQIQTNTADIRYLKTQLNNLPNEIASGLYGGYLSEILYWENGWINSSGNYDSSSQRHLTQVFSSANGQRVINDSESIIYIAYFTSFSSLSSFVYDSYVAVNIDRYADIDTTKPYFLIESLSETKEGLNGAELHISSTAEYLSNENIQKIIKEKKQNASAYVSGNAIAWYNSGTTCFLTINGDIVVRTNYGTTANNIIAQISVSDLLDTVENAGYTVTDGVISGDSFAIVFDFDDNTLKALSPANKEIFDNTLILFVHHYLSWTGGELINNANFDDIKTIKNSIQDVQNSLNVSLNAIENRVEEISPTLPSFLEPETSTCFNELVNACDEKTLVIAFTTDNHYGAPNGMNFPTTATSIKSINEKFPIDFVVDGGDLINGDKTKTENITYLSNAVRMLLDAGKPAYTLIGNHDDGSFTNTELPLLSKGEMYALLERHSGINLDYIDRYEHYGYKDFDEYNIRVIFLDALYGTNGHLSAQWGYSDNELTWFTTTALNTDKQVVMFSHMAFSSSFAAYGINIKNGAEMRTAVENFIANGGVVVALFHGHNHWDYIGQYSETNGFKEVSTGCGRIISGPDIPYAHPEGAIMPEREEGTITQELWDIITIKPTAREVKMIRYGAGSNRIFNY